MFVVPTLHIPELNMWFAWLYENVCILLSSGDIWIRFAPSPASGNFECGVEDERPEWHPRWCVPLTSCAHPQGPGGGATHRQVLMGGAAEATWRRPVKPHGQKYDRTPKCDTVRLISVCGGQVPIPCWVCWVLWGWSVLWWSLGSNHPSQSHTLQSPLWLVASCSPQHKALSIFSSKKKLTPSSYLESWVRALTFPCMAQKLQLTCILLWFSIMFTSPIILSGCWYFRQMVLLNYYLICVFLGTHL